MSSNGKEKPGRSGKASTVPFVWRKNTGPALTNSWADIDEGVLHNVVTKVTKAGNAIIFAVTSDGGAFSVCVLVGQDKIREYPHGKEECELLLNSLAETFDA